MPKGEATSQLLQRYADALHARGFSPRTVAMRLDWLRRFVGFLGDADVLRVAPAQIETWRNHLGTTATRNGMPRRPGTLNNALVALKSFYKVMVESDLVGFDPTHRIVFAKRPQRLPPPVVSVGETASLLESIIPTTPRGARDRALLELLYATGMRVGELCALDLDDLDLDERLCRIRKGKGGKQRLVPFGEIAAGHLDQYLRRERSRFAPAAHNRALWLNRWGERLHEDTVRERLRIHARTARVSKRLTPHGLRHACATHLLENRADLRHIQELLGHASVQSTQIYTHVSIQHLKATLARCHPRERGGTINPEDNDDDAGEKSGI